MSVFRPAIYVWYDLSQKGKDLLEQVGPYQKITAGMLPTVPYILVQKNGHLSYREAVKGFRIPLAALFQAEGGEESYDDAWRYYSDVVLQHETERLIWVARNPLYYQLPRVQQRLQNRGELGIQVEDQRLVQLSVSSEQYRKRQERALAVLLAIYTRRGWSFASVIHRHNQPRLPKAHPSLAEVAFYARGKSTDEQVNFHCLLCPECTLLASLLLNAKALMK